MNLSKLSSRLVLILFLISASTAFIFVNTQNIENSYTTDNSETSEYNPSALCGNRLYDDNTLKQEEVEEICQILSITPNFLIRIRKHVEALTTGNSVLLQAASEKFFNLKCSDFLTMCQNGFLIDLYTEDRIIIIQPGSQMKKKVNDNYRQRVIESMRFNLLKNEWGLALEKAVILLDYKEKGGATKLNKPQSPEPKKFIFEFLVPVLTVLFIGLTLLLLFNGKEKVNTRLFNYFDRLLELWEEIETSPEKCIILKPRTCLFCLKEGALGEEGKSLFKFLYCNHSYHHLCMYKWGLHTEKCCPCSFEPVENEEFSTIDSTRPPLLNEEDIKHLFGFILDAYRKEEVYDYFVESERKIEQFNEKYNVSLEEICWIYSNKLNDYKKYRIFFKMWRSIKLLCCIIAFYPSKILNSKKGKLIKKLLAVRSTGSTIRGFK